MSQAVREYRPISNRLWSSVVQELGGASGMPLQFGPHDKPDEAFGDVSVELVQAVVKLLEDSEPFCDHSVGICACGTRGVLEELRLWLRGRQTCHACGGDGFVIPDDSKEDFGPLDCPVCEGGSVPLPA